MHEPKTADYQKLNKILNNNDVSIDEQKRIKIAFVEGYESGLQRQIYSRATMLFKLVQNIIILGSVILFICFYRM